jgi:uncharacterized 2Fe-2S/4Fe-4S cluster protein (DUF4445 family)
MSPESSLAFLRTVKLGPPSSSDKTADAERLANMLYGMGMNVSIPLDILRRLPGELRKNEFEIKLIMGVDGPGSIEGQQSLKVLDIGRDSAYGVAIDIGSTNIECSLFDLVTGSRIGVTAIENPQVKFGPDVLTRVQGAMTGNFEALNCELTAGVNALIEKIAAESGIWTGDIFAAAVAGNTIMSHFFLGLDVSNIPLSPYIPAVSRAVYCNAGELGLVVNRNAAVYVFPNAGSYVGGDVISGMLFSGIHKEEEPVLFIDVGTNVEVTLGCRDWIMTGAGAAGPALEGGVASIGRKAESGTISRVSIDPLTGEIGMHVISDSEPEGICGSGLIDLVSEMFTAGIIDRLGKFTGLGNGVIEKDGTRAYVIHSSRDRDLFLTENEIRNFLLSKAAMFSFLYVFVKSVGLTFSDIRKVYIAGALGCGINTDSAIRIGMLPDMPRERFVPLGNSSLGGAEMVLLDRTLIREIDAIASKITYREMNEDAELMHILQGGIFIPHTEPEMLKG